MKTHTGHVSKSHVPVFHLQNVCPPFSAGSPGRSLLMENPGEPHITQRVLLVMSHQRVVAECTETDHHFIDKCTFSFLLLFSLGCLFVVTFLHSKCVRSIRSWPVYICTRVCVCVCVCVLWRLVVSCCGFVWHWRTRQRGRREGGRSSNLGHKKYAT